MEKKTAGNFWKINQKKLITLDPLDRVSEILFGLIMVMTFTGTISVAVDNQDNIGNLLWAALGCNFAWGLVDAIMYLLNTKLSRGHDFSQIDKITSAESIEKSREIARESISPFAAMLLSDSAVDQMVSKIKQLPEQSKNDTLTKKDFIIAFEIFLLVFMSTFPVAIPFIFMQDVMLAMRISNFITLLLLFLLGFKLAGYTGYNPLYTAMLFVSIGIMLVTITIVLGG